MNTPRTPKRSSSSLIQLLCIVAIPLLPLGCKTAYQYGTAESISITVKDKERIFEGSGKEMRSRYLVFTEQETFQNIDAWLSGKFAASDLQGALEAGHTYRVRVYGWRLPFFSAYRNIVRIER